ncbi:hypothetical protein [Sulfurimonas sp.]|uniref:hypothetical protein n=1 Tax=Sulfurimonas sp. TaxID=2022749 RepID=UPI0025FDD2F5|nr:hypothetical protein [Sulfurimonas sp.]MCK9473127.1 hypothetical protein [Sulfurimonas sp.]
MKIQTIHLEVKDVYVKNIISLLNSVKGIMIDKIEIEGDENLKADPYFYERREELHKLRDDVRSGNMQMFDFNESMDALLLELQK